MYPLLTGLTVIEVSSFVASPTAGLYLAQMGARVIRVDQIGGGLDFSRWPITKEGHSLYWENLNRGKESLALDLSNPKSRTLLQRLIRRTGQLITNFPVNGFLSYDQLCAVPCGADEHSDSPDSPSPPDLIVARIMGKANGATALDYTVNSAVGYPDITGLGDAPVNHVLPAWDLLTGAYAAFAMLSALHYRTASGSGQEIRIPLSDVAIASVANLGGLAEVLYSGANRERLGNAVYGAFGRDFVTADGVRLMIMAMTPRQWAGLVKVLDMSKEVTAIEQTHGVSFAKDEGLRFTYRDELFPLVEAKVARCDYADLQAALDSAGCCYGRYQTTQQAAQDSELVCDNPLFSMCSTNPSGLSYPAAGAIATLAQMERGDAKPAPRLGAHSHAILQEMLGLSDSAIADLQSQGIVAQA